MGTTQHGVNGVRGVSLGVADLKASTKFYVESWGLSVVAERPDAVYLRATGSAHHVISLHKRSSAALLCVDLTAADRASVDALHKSVRDAGMRDVEAPAAVTEPGGGYGFAFKDPEGRVLRVLAGDEQHKDAGAKPDLPIKVTHVVLNSRDRDGMAEFFARVLGFRVIDRTRMMTFMCCSPEHHSIAFANGEAPTLNHIAFLMKDLDSVMRGAGRMRDHGHDIQWGVGRHGPGNNVFAYFVGPDDVVIEYTSEVQLVDDSYKVRGPEEWTWPPGRIDHWGIAVGPTDRLKTAQRRIAFAPEIFHPVA